MNRRTFVRQLLAVCVIALATAIAVPPAGAGRPKKLNPPTELWKSFPLGRPHAGSTTQPSTPAQRPTHRREASGQTGSRRNPFPTGLLATVLLATMLGATGILVVRRSVPALGGARRPRERPHQVVELRDASQANGDLLEALRPSERAPEPDPVRQPEHTNPRRLHVPTARVYVVPQPEAAATDAEPPPTWQGTPAEDAAVEGCEIKLWRGYVKCQLYAALDGSRDAWAVSPAFRLRAGEAPNAAALEALSALLATLEHAGWEVVDVGEAWHERRLERSRLPS